LNTTDALKLIFKKSKTATWIISQFIPKSQRIARRAFGIVEKPLLNCPNTAERLWFGAIYAFLKYHNRSAVKDFNRIESSTTPKPLRGTRKIATWVTSQFKSKNQRTPILYLISIIYKQNQKVHTSLVNANFNA